MELQPSTRSMNLCFSVSLFGFMGKSLFPSLFLCFVAQVSAWLFPVPLLPSATLYSFLFVFLCLMSFA